MINCMLIFRVINISHDFNTKAFSTKRKAFFCVFYIHLFDENNIYVQYIPVFYVTYDTIIIIIHVIIAENSDGSKQCQQNGQ